MSLAQLDPGGLTSDLGGVLDPEAATGTAQNATDVLSATKPQNVSEVAGAIWGTIHQIWMDFLGHLPLIVGGLILIILTAILAAMGLRTARRITARARMRQSLRDLISKLTYIGIWILGLLLAAMVMFPGLGPTQALGGLGILSLAVGFAFKDIFENFFAGILMLWRYPFEPGDFIECEGITGKVEDIYVRMSLIRETNGELVIVPNSFLYNNPVNVLTSLTKRRVEIIAGIAYGERIEDAVPIIQKAVEGCASVDKTHPVQVFPQGFGSSSIDIEVAWWTDPRPVDIRASRGEVVTAIKRALDDNGIEIPFPYRTLTFKDPLRVVDREEED